MSLYSNPTLTTNPVKYSYDYLNRLTAIKQKIGANNVEIKGFKYFGLEKVRECSEGNGKIIQSFSYDKQDWLKDIKGKTGAFDAGTFVFNRENNGIKESVNYIVNGIVKGVIRRSIIEGNWLTWKKVGVKLAKIFSAGQFRLILGVGL